MRAVDRFLALVLALALAAAGGLLAVEAALLAAGDDAWLVPRARWERSLGELAWDDGAVQVAAGTAVAVGVVVVALQLLPRRPRRIRLAGDPGRDVWLSREGLQRRVARAVVDAHDEVVGARVRARRRRVAVRGTVVASSDRGTPARVHATATEAVAALGPERAPAVKVRLVRNRTRVR